MGIKKLLKFLSSFPNIIVENKFLVNEQNERSLALRSKDASPIGKRNEWGKFLGKSDIAQIRYFNTGSYDMTDLLNLDGIWNEFKRYDTWDRWYQFNEETGNDGK